MGEVETRSDGDERVFLGKFWQRREGKRKRKEGPQGARSVGVGGLLSRTARPVPYQSWRIYELHRYRGWPPGSEQRLDRQAHSEVIDGAMYHVLCEGRDVRRY